jgi:hypothetical protein
MCVRNYSEAVSVGIGIRGRSVDFPRGSDELIERRLFW